VRSLSADRLCLKFLIFFLYRLKLSLKARLRHPHYFIRYPVGFLLVFVARLVYRKFGLHTCRACVTGSASGAYTRARQAKGTGLCEMEHSLITQGLLWGQQGIVIMCRLWHRTIQPRRTGQEAAPVWILLLFKFWHTFILLLFPTRHLSNNA
jgi:hypothetical protein